MGRFPSPGFIEGLTSSFGDFDECLDSKTPELMEQQFEGKYCLLNVKLPYPDLNKLGDEPVNKEKYQIKLFDYFHMHQFNSIRAMTELLGLSNGSIYNLGICIPSVCSPDEISDVLNKGKHKSQVIMEVIMVIFFYSSIPSHKYTTRCGEEVLH